MTMTLNYLTPTPAAPDAAPLAAPIPAADAPPPAAAATAAALPAAAFAQWLGLGLQPDPASREVDAAASPAVTGAQAADRDAPGTDQTEASDQPSSALAPEGAQLAAMAMPLMLPPAAAAFIRTASDAPAGQLAAPGAPGDVLTPRLHPGAALGLPAAALPPAPALAQSQAAAFIRVVNGAPSAQPGASGVAADDSGAPLSAAELRTGLDAAPMPAAAAPVPAPAGAHDSATAADQIRAAAGGTSVPDQAPAAARSQAGASGAADARLAAGAPEAAPVSDDSAAPAPDRPATNWGVGAPATAAPRVAGSVVLAGPPAAWRQTLHEALGENLNLQLSRRSEQAVIRLDPPMFGRVEIAIRHSAGALDIQISATHGEVLRQLHAVSDNLRSDLAQRQFSEVAVTVLAAPRSAQGALHGEQQQGRGRQPARDEQPQDPGRALADADDASSTFSLNGRA